MIMRITWGKLLPGKWDLYENLWNAHAAATSATHGLNARWLLRDTEETNAGYSISLWHSLEELETYSPQKEGQALTSTSDCFSGEYITKICEVRGTAISKDMAPGERG